MIITCFWIAIEDDDDNTEKSKDKRAYIFLFFLKKNRKDLRRLLFSVFSQEKRQTKQIGRSWK